MDAPLEPLEGARPYQHLDFRLPASRTVRKLISIVLSLPICNSLLQQAEETNTPQDSSGFN